MKKLKCVFLFVLLIFLGINASAQTTTKRDGGLYLLQGFRNQNFSQIDNQLESFGFNATKKTQQFSGAGGYGWMGNFKIGGEGNYFRNQNQQNNQNTVLNGFGGNIYTAYLINPKSKIHILPLIGVGGESLSISAYQNNNVTTFSQALEQPQNLHLTTGSFYFKTALQVEYKAKKSVIGFQLGYQLASHQQWQINERSFSDAPSDNLSALCIQLIIGIE